MPSWGSFRRRLLAGALVVGLAAAAGGSAAPAFAAERSGAADAGAFSGELEIVLWKALFQGKVPEDGPANLLLELAADAGRWRRAWGMALGYNNGIHAGLVTRPAVEPGAIRFDLHMTIEGDIWVQGGPAAYSVELKRGPGGAVEGAFTGTFKDQRISGRVSGEIRPLRPVRIENYKPVEPGEHPRILFRKGDLARLKERAQTPFGQAYLQAARQSGDGVSHGMLYQLTGEAEHAAQAMQIVRGNLADPDCYTSDRGAGSGGWGHRLVADCLAYDLCFDAWPEAFRRELDARLLDELPKLIRYLAVTSHPNLHPCSNYYGPGHGAPAIGSLLYWADKGPPPEKPVDPLDQIETIPPAAQYQPGEGVPVVDFVPGRFPQRWIHAGPLPFRAQADTFRRYAKAPPEVGTVIQYFTMVAGPQMQTVEFKPLGEGRAGDGGIDVVKLAGGSGATTNVLFTVLKVPEEQTVGLAGCEQDMKVWLAGREIEKYRYYRLKPGLYPMLVFQAAERASGRMAPRLAAPGSDDLAGSRSQYEIALAAWEVAQRAWEESGGTDADKRETVGRGQRRMYWHYRLGVGDGGFQAETGVYALIASWYPLVYATAYRKVFGRDASPHPDITHLMPRRMMQVVFRQDGTTAVQKINSVVGFDVRWCAAAFPIVPDEYKPSLLWAWNRATGVRDAASVANVFQGRGDRGGLDLAHTFLHYPLDIRPVHPSQGMPRTWEAPTFGFYLFRSGWESDDDFVGQVFLKAAPVGGWNHGNAATFRIMGLGHEWVTGSTSRNGVRQQEPVVLLPEDEISPGDCGRLTYLKTEKDGSGSLTIDLADVYASPKSRSHDRSGIRCPDRFVASGITGLRALAFDYSGASGAPAMMVLVDKIQGGKSKAWLWQLPEATRKGEKLDVRVEGNTFTLDWGDASMKATFITPDAVRLDAGMETIQEADPRHGFHGEINRVKATGGDNFFVVATFQRKDPPAVKVEGKGLAARVTVGGRTVSFDGEKIVLGR